MGRLLFLNGMEVYWVFYEGIAVDVFLLISRRVRRYPGERRGKLMQIRMETTLQKMEMPKQTRYNSKVI